MQIFSVHDQVAGYFLPPFFARNSGQAQRMFIGCLGESFPHRADFSLYLIGSFDQDTGSVTSHDPSRVLAGLSIPVDLDPRVPHPTILQTAAPTPADEAADAAHFQGATQ